VHRLLLLLQGMIEGAPAEAQHGRWKARNVIERLPKPLHASLRRALRQAWELDDADKAERLLRNLARRQPSPRPCQPDCRSDRGCQALEQATLYIGRNPRLVRSITSLP
jgi:hypothetical protein